VRWKSRALSGLWPERIKEKEHGLFIYKNRFFNQYFYHFPIPQFLSEFSRFFQAVRRGTHEDRWEGALEVAGTLGIDLQ
jgi:hypothetical protein